MSVDFAEETDGNNEDLCLCLNLRNRKNNITTAEISKISPKTFQFIGLEYITEQIHDINEDITFARIPMANGDFKNFL